MSNEEKRNIFIKYIRDIYLENSDVNIYAELSSFYTQNNQIKKIRRDSLINVQSRLKNIFGGFLFGKGYFWCIENRCGKNDNEFYDLIKDGIKIYVSCDKNNIYEIASDIIGFMQENKIITQSKIAKEMRNDAFVIRVSTKEEALKVIKYINDLKYTQNICPNPFLLSNGKTSITMDGTLSYNSTLSKLLEKYFFDLKNTNSLNSASSEGFSEFVDFQINMLKGENRNVYMELYNINDGIQYKDFLMVAGIIKNNLDDKLNLDKLFQQREKDDVLINSQMKDFNEDDKNRILYVINTLTKYYSIDQIHKIIDKYIKDGNITYFTRRDNIRYLVQEYFSPEKLKNIIVSMGKEALYFAINETINKYGDNQIAYALGKVIRSNDISGFTNTNEARSILGLIIPKEYLRNLLREKLTSESDIRAFDNYDKLSEDRKNIEISLLSNTIAINILDELDNNKNKKR